MEISNYKDFRVRGFIYPHGEYRLGSPVEIIDEGSFYRIEGTHIFDKHKIENAVAEDDRLLLKMTDKTVELIIEKR